MVYYDDSIYEAHANFYSALGNEKRLHIVHLLGEGERSVGEIAEELGLSPSNVSQHLRIMRDLGLVRGRKNGTQVFYTITSRKFIDGYRLIREGLAEIHFSRSEVLFPEDREEHT
ncbi:MAG: winged helix-turn-helix transcriptional regulator [Deltaproteobacteria bacterium]|nr:winged helix-turn-helix transcriptional regulator [Deltaproteobacteria bacterium]